MLSFEQIPVESEIMSPFEIPAPDETSYREIDTESIRPFQQLDCQILELLSYTTIIRVHKFVTSSRLQYPDVLQNQILTIGRTSGILSKWQEQEPNVWTVTESFEALKVTLEGCTAALHRLVNSTPVWGCVGSNETWDATVELLKRALYEVTGPLLEFHCAYKR
jgi:hypothetical protein